MKRIWSTPQAIFDKLDAEFHFSIDLCADKRNHKVANYLSRKESLIGDIHWKGFGFLNPPYGAPIGKHVAWAYDQAMRGYDIVALLPTRTNPPWWHDYILKHNGEIRFIRKKLAFEANGHRKHGVPFTGHAIIVFGHKVGSPKVSSWEQPKC